MDPRLYAHLERTESFNLFFCFRWLLIWFKREFGWDDIMRLWEVLWTDHLNREFHLFVALAILDKHRNVIMDHLTQFDEILKYINDLAQNIDLEETLQCAEILHVQFRRRVEAVEKRRKELDEELSKRAVWTNEEKRRNVEEEKARLPIISEGLRELMGVDETGKGKTVENGLRRRGTKE
ncbi:rab-GTPase-TBC domain-containing protein [Jimgerdemannia flammicorona]|uniref:Rab-GTPase-TBC domain-containing protein n=1 Tax=Jimgerdemannia flammicorona TaxID=994334 RepID=A0A433D203_9FUNG|nr:rab-GTPase-TBC domain-containing protein [Jimgerdemannia flammicorona]